MTTPQDMTTTDEPINPTPAPADGTPPPDEAEPSPETETLAKRRADELTRARRDAERRADAAEHELAALKRKVDAGARPLPPSLAEFTDGAGYVDAVRYQQAQVAYEDKILAWQRDTAPAPGTPSERATTEAAPPETFTASVQALSGQHADVYEVINRPVFTREMRDAIFASEQGAELAYWLGSNQAEAMRIGQLPSAQMWRELGKIEATKLGAAPAAPAPRSVSGAPDPIAPVSATTTSTRDPEKMTIDEWMAWDKNRRIERLKKNPLGL